MLAIWWEAQSLFIKMMLVLAIITSLIFVVQMVLSFIGVDMGADINMDTDIDLASDSGSIYTFRNLINFLLGFSWTIVLLGNSLPKIILIPVAIVVGVAIVIPIFYLFKFLNSMQESGNIDINKEAIGCKGIVYLNIPKNNTGLGKVQITISNSVREYDAITYGEVLPTSTPIVVTDIVGGNILVVTKKD